MSSINRREMLKLSSAGSLAALASSVTVKAETPAQAAGSDVPRWEVFEATLNGPSTGNPFLDVQLTATFSLGHRTVEVDGFYDGHDKYKIRFMPDTEGDWTYTTRSTTPALD